MVVPQTPTATAAESGAASYFGRPHTTHSHHAHSMDLNHPNMTTHTGPRQAMTPGGSAGSGGFPGFAQQQAQSVSESPAGWPGFSASPFATTAPVAMTDVDRSTTATASMTSPARKHALPQSTPPNAHLVRGETASPTLSRNFDQISIRDGAAVAAVSGLHGTPPARLAGQPTPAVPIAGSGSGARHGKQQVDATALQDLLRQAMESPYGSQTSSRQTTSPTPSFGPSVMQIGPVELSKLLHEDGSGHGGSKEVLLLDLRATASFTQSRVKGAIHLGIPATLLKRSSYTIAKIAASVNNQVAHDKIVAWQEARVVILYDSESFNVGEGTPLYQLGRKFTNDSWPGQAYTVKGGFAAIQKETPDLVDSRQASPEPTTHAPARPGAPKLSLKQLGNFSCVLPTQKSVANPFFNNIRQNQDLIGGVGQPIPLQVPEASLAVRQRLPRWLRQVAYEEGGAQRVADRFLKIEQEEQRRMQAVLGVSQDAPAAAQADTTSVDARDTKHSVAAALERGEKNRYNNIWPFENARVKLQDCASDYINASHLHFRRSERHYIATQGPLPATTRDFWQLVWENDVRTVVMLTNLVEGGQAKCHAYWSDAEQMLPFALELVSEEHVESKFQGLPRHDEGERVALTIRRFELRHTERPLAGVRQVQQLQYADWPDFHVVQPAAILAILQETHLAQVRAGSPAVKRRKSISGSMLQASRAVAAERPVVAHCSAGCGRTGVFCTTDTVTALVQAQIDRAGESRMTEGAIDGEGDDAEDDEDLVEAAVRAFRDQRLSIVQTLRQFVLCYDAVLLFSLAYIRQRYGLA